MYKYCYSNEGAIYAKGLWRVVAYESFRNLLIIHKDKTEEIIV